MTVETTVKNGTIPTICRQCDMRCGINVHIENGKPIAISSLKSHPENGRHVCLKGRAAIDTACHEDRLVKPLKKKPDGSFEEITLEQAMREIAARLITIKADHGARAVGCWQGEALGFAQQEKYARRFIHAFGSPNFFSADSVCWASRFMSYKLVQGYRNPRSDFSQANAILFWGSNPPDSHPTFLRSISEGRKKGARLIVIDPRRTKFARQADMHLGLRPGSDGALAWGLIRILIEGKSYDRDFVDNFTVGFDELARYSQTFTPEYVSDKTGLDPRDVKICSRAIADGLPKVINYAGVAIEHQNNGFDSVRAIAALGGLCGAVDVQGGEPWPENLGQNDLTLYDELPLTDQKPVGAQEFPVLYDLLKECHTMTGINTMLGEGEYAIKALIVAGANPVLSNPNSEKVTRAFANLDLLVVRDLFLTGTAALADYVLPAASFLERSELHCYPHFQWVALSRKTMSIPNVIDEYAFWRDLAGRLGFAETYFPWETEEEVNRWLLEPTGISLEELQRHPEGVRYRPITYHKHRSKPLPTPTGKFEFRSQYLEDRGYPALPEYRDPLYTHDGYAKYPYVLISGARKIIYLHSRYRNISRLRRMQPTAKVEIHPEDADRLAIGAGDRVRVVSEVGSIVIQAKIVDASHLRPGVIQIPHGWAGESNVNMLTLDLVNDPVSGFPQLKSVPVRLEKISRET